MIRCGRCNKTFDEKRIAGICPYCGSEKNLELIVGTNKPQEEPTNTALKEKPADTAPKEEPADSTKALLSIIIVVVFVVLAVFSTSNYGKKEKRTPIENLQFIMDVERLERR